MGTNVYKLFQDHNSDDEDSIRKKNQERFESVMKSHLPTLVIAIESSFIAMKDELNGRNPAFLNHLSKSNRMNEQIKGRITEAFGTNVKPLRYNRFGLFLEGYVILFKKLDKYGRPSNVPTGNSLMLTGQSKLNFPGEPEILHVGYVIDSTWEAIKSINAVKIENQEVQWSINLQRLAGSSLTVRSSTTIETDDIGLDVKPKAKNNKKTG